jgi:bleomycin hydrolase
MKELVTQAIDRGSPVYFGSDVESDVDAVTGIMHPDIFMSDSVYGFANTHSHEITKRSDRIFFEQTVPTHAMLMVGYDRPSKRGPVVKFKVVNSWGRDSGDQGIYHMYSDWFDGHVTDIVILKKLLSSRELRLWEKPSKVLDAEVHNYFKY